MWGMQIFGCCWFLSRNMRFAWKRKKNHIFSEKLCCIQYETLRSYRLEFFTHGHYFVAWIFGFFVFSFYNWWWGWECNQVQTQQHRGRPQTKFWRKPRRKFKFTFTKLWILVLMNSLAKTKGQVTFHWLQLPVFSLSFNFASCATLKKKQVGKFLRSWQ